VPATVGGGDMTANSRKARAGAKTRKPSSALTLQSGSKKKGGGDDFPLDAGRERFKREPGASGEPGAERRWYHCMREKDSERNGGLRHRKGSNKKRVHCHGGRKGTQQIMGAIEKSFLLAKGEVQSGYSNQPKGEARANS